MSEICDHTSVGLLAWNGPSLLLITRKKPPYGVAPPAGHVDSHGSYAKSAKAELAEETGLNARSLILIASGAKSNPCRRQGADWHYWRIYEADWDGQLKPSPDETKNARWYSLREIVQLGERTRKYLAGKVCDEEWFANPGLEPVWLDWFEELRLITRTGFSSAGLVGPQPAADWARQYAWNWFEYHASQRLTVFRFYLVIVAFLFAGYVASLNVTRYAISTVIGGVIVVVSILFWFFDLRNRQLVNLSEAFLKKVEADAATALGVSSVAILAGSEKKGWWFFNSFRRINAALFLLASVLGGLSVWYSLNQYREATTSATSQQQTDSTQSVENKAPNVTSIARETDPVLKSAKAPVSKSPPGATVKSKENSGEQRSRH